MSQNLAKAAESPQAELQVSPKVCVGQAGEPCSMQLEVAWEAPHAMDLCLRLREGEETLKCWHQRREGSFSMAYASEASIALQLVTESLSVLDEVEVKVLSRDPRDSRRRRRHVWSIL